MPIDSRFDLNALEANRNIKSRFYWENRLSGFIPDNYLIDLTRTGQKTTGRAESEYTLYLPASLSGKLNAIAPSDKARHVVLLAAAAILVNKLSGKQDIALFTPVYAEDPRSANEIVPVRYNNFSGVNFLQFLLASKDGLIQDLRHGKYPPDKALGIKNEELKDLSLIGLQIEQVHASNAFERLAPALLFSFNTGEKLSIKLCYDGERFGQRYATRLLDRFVGLLTWLLDNKEKDFSSFDMLNGQERTELLDAFNDTAKDYPKDKTIVALFEEQVVRSAEDISLKYGNERITYRELDQRKNSIAAYLQRKGIVPGDPVGIMLERDMDLVPWILGILKAGGVYVPVDPAYPAERILAIVAGSGAKMFVTRQLYNGIVLPGDVQPVHIDNLDMRNEEPQPVTYSEGSIAYVLFTSGSTGKPKGVMISHRSLVNYTYWAAHQYVQHKPAVFALHTSISFDLTVTSLFTPLITGGSILIYKEDGEKLLIEKVLADNAADVIKLTPSHLRAISNLNMRIPANRGKYTFIVGGEEFPAQLADEISRKFNGRVDIYNEYGPTEATVGCMVHKFDPDEPYISVPLGVPGYNNRIYVLDASLSAVPVGVEGEIYIAGDSLAEGYMHNGPLTQERFIALPQLGEQKVYKTGDLAVRSVDGHLLYKGRIDDQVKLRGYRIELEEIGHCLTTHENIKQAVVICREDVPEDKYLVAYYLSAEALSGEALKAHLSVWLPVYMIPEHYVHLDSLPLTPNGKLDKRALPAPELTPEDTYSGPSDSIEEGLQEIWAQIFKTEKDKISVTKSFMELGGHSLKILQMLNGILREFNVKMSINSVFEHKTIRSLSKHIRTLSGADYAAITKAPERDYYKLSTPQRRIYFLYELNRASLSYNIPKVIKLEGQLDKGKLEDAFCKIIERHEVLRTRFTLVDGTPVQQVLKDISFEMAYFQSAESEVQDIIDAFIQPFDLNIPPLLRAGLITISDQHHILLVDMHHIVTDGISESILIKDFLAFYKGEELPPLQVQYKDYIEWQEGAAYQQRLLKQKEFWLKEFATSFTPMELPADYSPGLIETAESSSEVFELTAEEIRRLKEITEKEDVTLFMILFAVYNILLSKLSHQEDIVVSIPVAGREHPDLENMLGMFVNTLPVRNFPQGGMTFSAFLLAVKQRTLACFENPDYPFDLLTDHLKIDIDKGRNPISKVVFSYQNLPETVFKMPGLKAQALKRGRTDAKFDINLFVYDNGERLILEIDYPTNLFRKTTIDRFIAYYKKILLNVIDNPDTMLSELDLLADSEKQTILEVFNNTCTAYPRDKTITDLFEDQLNRSENKTALKEGNNTYTYRQLNERANQIAHYLREQGVAPDTCIAVLAHRSIAAIVATLGILKSGGTYLPLDPQYPVARICHMLEDANVKIVLSQQEYRDLLDGRWQIANMEEAGKDMTTDNPATVNTPTDLAYVMYTSGSTGTPKGVAVTHRNIVRLVRNTNYVSLDQSTCILQTGAPVFDATTFEIWGSLLNGGTLCLVDKDVLLDTQLLGKALREEKINTLWLTSPLFDQHVRSDAEIFAPLQYLLVGGDILTPQSINKVRSMHPNLKIINGYGPTEGTTFSVCYEIDKDYAMNIPIGKPISNSTAYILNETGALLPVGISGELYIGGDGVARGYLNNEQLTAERFIDNPFLTGDRLYKTGDRARWLPDGTIEYLGRMDNQVKIRGFRIEPEEIRIKLLQYDDVRDAVILAGENKEGKYLAAYYIADQVIETTRLRSFLKEMLPDYMVPAYYIHIAEIPLTTNGKIDRKVLPDPVPDEGKDLVVAGTQEEKLLQEVWEGVLGVKNIGITDDLFELGADSLKSIQISLRIQAAGYDVSLRDILSCKTIKELAQKITDQSAAVKKTAIHSKMALTPAQVRFLQEHPQDRDHFNQSVMLNFPKGISGRSVRSIFEKLEEHHEALRMVFRQVDGTFIGESRDADIRLSLREMDLKRESDPSEVLLSACNKIQRSIDPGQGPLMKLGLFHLKDGSRLLIVVHDLIMDHLSWEILFEDMERLYEQVLENKPLSMPVRTASLQAWSRYLQEYRKSRAFIKAKTYWEDVARQTVTDIVRDNAEGTNRASDSEVLAFRLDEHTTACLQKDIHHAFITETADILLTALITSISQKYGSQAAKIEMEEQRKKIVGDGINIARTIGRFSAVYPVILSMKGDDPATTIKWIKQVLNKVPNNGIDYQLYKYPTYDANMKSAVTANSARIFFNYRKDLHKDINKNWSVAAETTGDSISPDAQRSYDWEILCASVNGQMEVRLTYSKDQYRRETIEDFMNIYRNNLIMLIGYCMRLNNNLN